MPFAATHPDFGRRIGIGLGMVVTLGLAFFTWLAPNPVVRLGNTALDYQFRLRGERPPGQEVVLVLIDEKSLKEIGRWPWPRDMQALLIDRIRASSPTVIGLDIIYAEAEESRARQAVKVWLDRERLEGRLDHERLKLLDSHFATLDTDRLFAQSLAKAGSVVLAMPFFVPEGPTQESLSGSPEPVAERLKRSEFMIVKRTRSVETSRPYEAASMLPPLDIFAQQVRGLGHVYRLPDHDGVTRREVLALQYGDAYYPSFALEVARLYLGKTREQVALVLGEGVRLGEMMVPTDQKSRMLIDYAGRDLRFPWVSAADVLHGLVPLDFFRGKAVLVGTAALGTYDQLSTPFSANFSGVEKNAAVIENILHKRFMTAALWSGPVELGLVLSFGLALTWILPGMRAFGGTCLTAGLGLSYVGTAQTLLVTQVVCLPVIMPMVTIGAVFLVTTVLNFVLKERQAREIQSMFASYVSPRIVQELLKSPSKATVGGQRKELTMMFADLVGFTAFSEHRSAEDVVHQLNEYLSAMTDVIFRWNGTLDKFVGDAIVVFWGAPLDQPDHAQLAVQCALEMRARLEQLQARWKEQGKPVLDNGIGINTGTALVGNIGAEGKKMDYTMIGDQVNLAARIQGLTRTLGHPILLTEFTAAKLTAGLTRHMRQAGGEGLDRIYLRKLQMVRVKGRQEPVGTYAVDCQPAAPQREENAHAV